MSELKKKAIGVVEPPGRARTLALVSGAHAVNHSYVPLMPLVWSRMMVVLGMTFTQLGWIIGITNIVGGIIQMWFGSLSRVFRKKDLLGIGSIVSGVSTAAMAGSINFSHVLWFRIINRVGGAPQHPCGNSLIAEQFEKNKRGKALGLNNSAAQVGMVIAPVTTAFLLNHFDWRWTLVIFSLPAVIIGVMAMMMIPEKSKVRSGGLKISDLGVSLTDIKSYFRDRNILSITGAQLFASGGRGIGIVLTYIPLFLLKQLHYSNMQTGVLVTCLTMASVIGPIGFGSLSDRFGRKRVLLFTYGASTLCTVVLALQARQTIWIPVLLFLIGMVVYAESPLQQSWMSDVTDEKTRDVNFGIFFTIGFGAGAIWGPVIGWIVDNKGFEFAFFVMALSYIAGALCVLPAKEKAYVKAA